MIFIIQSHQKLDQVQYYIHEKYFFIDGGSVHPVES